MYLFCINNCWLGSDHSLVLVNLLDFNIDLITFFKFSVTLTIFFVFVTVGWGVTIAFSWSKFQCAILEQYANLDWDTVKTAINRIMKIVRYNSVNRYLN